MLLSLWMCWTKLCRILPTPWWWDSEPPLSKIVCRSVCSIS